MNTTTLASIRNAAPQGTYHVKIHLAETTALGGLKVVQIAHLTDINNDALSAVVLENPVTGDQSYDSLSGLECAMLDCVVERIDYLVSPARLSAVRETRCEEVAEDAYLEAVENLKNAYAARDAAATAYALAEDEAEDARATAYATAERAARAARAA